MTNILILNFYQDALFDRTNGCHLDTVWFQNFTVGPVVTGKGGTGTGASYGAEIVGTNLAFQGPTYGSGNCSFTDDQFDISLDGTLYEPDVMSSCYIHNTANGIAFHDKLGFLSGGLVTNSFIWDAGYGNLIFDGTQCDAATCQPISAGTPAPNVFNTPATFFGTSATLYTQCLAVGNSKCQVFGGTSTSYGPYTGISGPLRVDVQVVGSGDGSVVWLNKNGAPGDAMRYNIQMPSSDQAAHVPLGVIGITETAGAGTASGGTCLAYGNQASSVCGVRSWADGHTSFPGGLFVPNLPLSCSGLPTGTLWNSGSVVSVCP